MPIDKHILPIVQVCYLWLALVPFILILSSASRALILTVIRKITRTGHQSEKRVLGREAIIRAAQRKRG